MQGRIPGKSGQFTTQKAETRRQRQLRWDAAEIRVKELVQEIEELEVEMALDAEWLTDTEKAKPRASRRLRYEWEERTGAARGYAVSRGPRVTVIKDGRLEFGRTERIPDMAILRRVIQAEYQSEAKVVRRRIAETRKRRQRILNGLTKAHQVVKAGDDSEVARRVFGSLTLGRALPPAAQSAALERRNRAGGLIAALRDCQHKVVAAEQEIDDQMTKFNEYGGKNRNLMMRWRLSTPDKPPQLYGPYLYQLISNPQKSWRRPIGRVGSGIERWEKLLTRDPDSPIEPGEEHGSGLPKQYVHDIGQGRAAAKLHSLYGRISRLARRRNQLVECMRRAERALNTQER